LFQLLSKEVLVITSKGKILIENKIKAYGVCIYKVKKNSCEILLCKSVSSLNNWGCLKGLIDKNETKQQCAKREFLEESSIDIDIVNFEEYFEQVNEEKDIGIWLVNAKKVKNLESYFFENKLLNNYLSWENSKVKFFDIKDLPSIKKKQKFLVSEITDFLKNNRLSH